MSNVAASSAICFAGFPAWAFLDSFASFGKRRNHTTATGLTSAKRTVEVSFELLDPPRVSRWFVHCAGLKKKCGFNGPPYLLNSSGSFIVMRMAFFRGGNCIFDYFVYSAGPDKPSLDLIPAPCPTVDFPKRVGILPSGNGKQYSVIFPVPRFKPRMVYAILVFSSENQSWSTKVASISVDPETTSHELVMHDPSKAIAAGCTSLAWIDLWRGILLCDRLNQDDPVLRLIKWPVPSPYGEILDLYSPDASRDATLSEGAIRFVEMKFDYDGHSHYSRDAANIGWTATVWKRAYSSKEWNMCFKVDIANILATHLSSSDLLGKLWDNKLNKLDLNMLSSAPPTLSLTNEVVVYFMANLVSDEALLLAVNVSDKKLEAAEETTFELRCSPCSFSRFLDARTEVVTTDPCDKCDKRENMELETYLLPVLDKPKDIEKHLGFMKPWCNKSKLLLCSDGPSSTLDTKIEAVTRCINGQSNPVPGSVDLLSEYIRVSGDLKSQMFMSVEKMKNGVRPAFKVFDKFKNGETSNDEKDTDAEREPDLPLLADYASLTTSNLLMGA